MDSREPIELIGNISGEYMDINTIDKVPRLYKIWISLNINSIGINKVELNTLFKTQYIVNYIST